MTRYFLFEYSEYYPCGGFDDLMGIFESESDALAKIKNENTWDDHVEIYSLDSGSDRLELLYYKFNVLDESNMIQSVIGNKEKKIIKLVGPTDAWKSQWPEGYRDAKMSDFKMEAEL